METLRFLMITTHYPPLHLGGDARFVEYLAKELGARGHEVHVLFNPSVYRILKGSGHSTGAGGQSEVVKEHPYDDSGGLTDPLLTTVAGTTRSKKRRLTDLALKIKPDVVHWHNTKGFFGSPLHVRGAIGLYTAHDFYSVCPRSNLLRPGYRLCQRPRFCQLCVIRWGKPPQLWRLSKRRAIMFPSGMQLISPSEFVAKRLEQDGIGVQHILRNFVPDKGRVAARAADPRILLYAGLLEPFKGPQTLLEAFLKSRRSHEFSLWMAGEGTLKDRLMERAARSEVKDRIHIPGHLDDSELMELMTRAAAVIVPSECHENSPLTALEALSAGVPVIGSDLGGLPEILNSSSGSGVFTAGSVDELARSIESLWTGKAELTERGKKAREAYQANHTPNTHLNRYLEIITRSVMH